MEQVLLMSTLSPPNILSLTWDSPNTPTFSVKTHQTDCTCIVSDLVICKLWHFTFDVVLYKPEDYGPEN